MPGAVWITGAGSGIGKSLAAEFCENGIPVIISGRDKQKLLNVKNQLTKSGTICEVYPVDISSADSVLEAYNTLTKKFNIEGLINNAGITKFKSVADHSIEEIDKIIAVNLNGSIYTIKSVLPDMIKQNAGTIINILSVAANTIFTESSVYSATKAGLSAFTKVLREELKGTNIRVINVYPGATKTPMWPDEAVKINGSKMMKPDDLAKYICGLYLTQNTVVTEELVLRPVNGDL